MINSNFIDIDPTLKYSIHKEDALCLDYFRSTPKQETEKIVDKQKRANFEYRVLECVSKADMRGATSATVESKEYTKAIEISLMAGDFFSKHGINFKQVRNTDKFEIVVTWYKDSPCRHSSFPYGSQAQKRGFLTDFTLKNTQNGAEVKCHRLVLSARSSYFETLFNAEMRESRSNEVNIPDRCSQEVLNAMMTYLYRGEVNLREMPMEQLEEFTILADRFRTEYLCGRCIREWIGRMNADNVQSILEFVCQKQFLELNDLKISCVEFLKDSLSEENLGSVETLAQKFELAPLLEACFAYRSPQEKEQAVSQA